jgi:hypothetical protein
MPARGNGVDDIMSQAFTKMSIAKTQTSKYTEAYTVQTAKSTATLTVGRTTYSADGTVRQRGFNSRELVPVYITSSDKAFGGALCWAQAFHHEDLSLNSRLSVALSLNPCAVMDGDTLYVRVSSQDPYILVIRFYLSARFTDPDELFDYLLPRIQEELGYDLEQAKRYLRSMPLYMEALKKLKQLQANKNEDGLYPMEYRIKSKYPIDEKPVTKAEDPVLFGYKICGPGHKDPGDGITTQIFFHLKRKDKDFTPVRYSEVGEKKMPAYKPSGARKSMFATIPEEESLKPPSTVPGVISVRSPCPGGVQEDDNMSTSNSTIQSRASIFGASSPDYQGFQQEAAAQEDFRAFRKQHNKKLKVMVMLG